MRGMELRFLLAAACALVAGAARAENLDTTEFDDWVVGRPAATTTLGATDAMPVVQGGQTRKLYPQTFFTRQDASNWSTAAGIWAGAQGGTGVANTGKTIGVGGNLTTTGAGPTTLAFPGSAATFTFPGASKTLLATDASNAALPDARVNLGLDGLNTLFYPAKHYGACVWGAANDVGPCINLAIAAATAAGGGVVIIPAGTFGVSTAIVNNTGGVKLVGAGAGITRSNAAPTTIYGATQLKWIGAAGAGPMLDVAALTGGSVYLHAVDVKSIMFNCDSLLDTCVRIQNVVTSIMDFAQAEARKTGILWTTNDLPSGSVGNQLNNARLFIRNYNAAYSASGLVLDKGAGASVNTSITNFEQISGEFGAGDGIVGCGADNVNIGNTAMHKVGTATTGSPFVIANSAYTPPSGVACNGYSRGHTIQRTSDPVAIQGRQTGSTFTARVGNTGTGAVNVKTYATNAITTSPNATLNFASTTGVVYGSSIKCGGTASGVYPNSIAVTVTGTTVVMRQLSVYGSNITQVPSGVSCTFTYGVTPSAVTGTYVLSTADGTNFTLTAPAGGNTQAGITVASGALRFTDMVIPWTGTALGGDAWDIVLPTAPSQIVINYVDKDNGVSAPHCEYGANATVAGGVATTTMKVCGIAGADITGPLRITNYMPNASTLSGQSGGTLILNNLTQGGALDATQTILSMQFASVNKSQLRTNSSGAVFLDSIGDITLGTDILGAWTGKVLMRRAVVGAEALTLTAGELGFDKIAASGTAPGATGVKEAWVCGTNAGTVKKIAYAGTSTTPVTIVDNVGGGVTGC